jgi:hypothetical protein
MAALPIAPRYLTREQAAAYLGYSESFFKEHVNVAPVREGRTVRFDIVDLDAWAAQRKDSNSGNDPQAPPTSLDSPIGVAKSSDPQVSATLRRLRAKRKGSTRRLFPVGE